MSLESETAQAISNLPGYAIPCPNGSLLVGSECERLARPQFTRGSRSGLTMMAACSPSCPLCETFFRANNRNGGGMKFGTPDEAIAAWNSMLETAPEYVDMLWKFIKRGLVPTNPKVQ